MGSIFTAQGDYKTIRVVQYQYCTYSKNRTNEKTKFNPYPNDNTLHGRVGAFKFYENILFSHYREFKIIDHQITHLGKDGTLFGECNFYYKGFNYHAHHNMTLTKENTEDKIVYHCSTLKRINEL